MASMELVLEIGEGEPIFVEHLTAIPVKIIKKRVSATVISEDIVIIASCCLHGARLEEEYCRCEPVKIDQRSSSEGILYLWFARSLIENTNDYCRVVIHAQAANISLNIAPVESQPISLILYRLVIEEINTASYVWYKDEGGKDNCIELKVKLVDKDGNKIEDFDVPLKATLIYENSDCNVPVQDILTLQNDPKYHIINRRNGYQSEFNIRINEVSSKHGNGNKCFRILISPVNEGNLYVTGAASSVAFRVMSKRNRPKDYNNVTGNSHYMNHSIYTIGIRITIGFSVRRERSLTDTLAISTHSDNSELNSNFVDSASSTDESKAKLCYRLIQIQSLFNKFALKNVRF